MPICTLRSTAVTIRCNSAFLLSSLFVALVWGVAASADLFAQAQESVFQRQEIETTEAPPRVAAEISVSPRQAGAQAVGGEGAVASGYRDVMLAYDSDRYDGLFRGSEEHMYAQRYDVPSGGRLTSVLVAPVYVNQYDGSSLSEKLPKDFTLKIWDVAADGLPGTERYSMDVQEPTNALHIARGKAYAFLQIDLPAEDKALGDLPDRIFAGLANAGTDENYLGFGVSLLRDTAPRGAAYLYATEGPRTTWYPLAQIPVQGGSLADHGFPVRPVFRIPSDSALEETVVSWDTGRDERLYIFGGADAIATNLYDVPENARLASVSVAPAYANELGNSGVAPGAPRDFTLKVWDRGDQGLPGKELYSMDVEERPYASHLLSNDRFWFSHLDLPAEDAALSDLPDQIFIGLVNKGSDSNYLLIAPSPRTSDSPNDRAYMYGTVGDRTDWFFLSQLNLENSGISLGGYVFPIRPRFVITPPVVSAEAVKELPSAVELAQNYPNPFNPSTLISWSQPLAERVRLSVYNLLGQQVAVPADGLYPAGMHEVRLDASGWPSGVYTYVLETETRIATRPMVLMK